MAAEKSPWNKFTEWWTGHALWEIAKTVIGAAIVSIAGTRLVHAAFGTATNLFLLVLGVLGVAWGIGLLPVRKNDKVSLFRESLLQKCDDILLGWKKLAEQYQDAKKETLHDPMSPGWASSEMEKPWPYKVGVLQGRTNALRED